jgi:FKBP-type peptidyl-prolyl cis-trans isomerase FklB
MKAQVLVLAAIALAVAAPVAGPVVAAPAKKAATSSVKITDPTPPEKIAETPAAPTADATAAWLAANAKQPGVVTTASGLQYKIVKSGDTKGPSPKEGDVIKVNYEGTLVDGTVFDSSFKRGKPALMPLGNLVPAWMEALPLMHPGDEWVLYVPPALGYGPEGRGPIPPNSVMIFKLQLLGMLSAD